MSYDPNNPSSIFQPGGIEDFMNGLNNAYRLRHGIPGGDPKQPNTAHFMHELIEAELQLQEIECGN